MPDILSVPVPNGTSALAWSGRQSTIATILFYNTDTVNTVWLGSLSNITPAGSGTIPILPNGTFSGDPTVNWYVTGSAAGIVPLVVVPNGQGYFLGITAGMGNLVIPSVQSPNFVEGVSGWQIRKDGSVEFNNGVFRGYIIGGALYIYSGAPGVGNPPIFSVSGVTTDPEGNTIYAGVWAGKYGGVQTGLSTSGTAGILHFPTGTGSFNAPAGLAGAVSNTGAELLVASAQESAAGQDDYVYQLLGSYSSGGGTGAFYQLVYVDANGGLNEQIGAGFAGMSLFAVNQLNAVKPGTGTSVTVPAVPEVWHSVTGDTGWSAVSGYSGIQYRLKADGNVQFTGAAQHASLTATTAINSSNPLATAYRPATIKVLSSGNSPLSRLMVEYRTDGILYALANASAPATIAEVDKAVPLSP